jgi:hypothetical protein
VVSTLARITRKTGFQTLLSKCHLHRYIWERSALNLSGSYNRANTTELDAGAGAGAGADGGAGGGAGDAMDMGGDASTAVVDTAFYKTFWSLQLFFQQPPSTLGTPNGWDTFYVALQAVLVGRVACRFACRFA